MGTTFLVRLKRGEDEAWYELWEVFGPALERMVERFSHRCFTPETVRDVSQETLLRLSKEIHRFDPERGVRFSTWLFQIARHVVAGEFAYRNAAKRGAGVKPKALEPGLEPRDESESPPEQCERAVFRAKVYRAMRLAEQRLDFLPFEVYKTKLTRNMLGKEIAAAVGVSEPTVSRYVQKARDEVRKAIEEVVAEYSFTDDDRDEVRRARLRASDDEFDAALSDIYIEEETSRRGYDSISRTVSALRGRR